MRIRTLNSSVSTFVLLADLQARRAELALASRKELDAQKKVEALQRKREAAALKRRLELQEAQAVAIERERERERERGSVPSSPSSSAARRGGGGGSPTCRGSGAGRHALYNSGLLGSTTSSFGGASPKQSPGSGLRRNLAHDW